MILIREPLFHFTRHSSNRAISPLPRSHNKFPSLLLYSPAPETTRVNLYLYLVR